MDRRPPWISVSSDNITLFASLRVQILYTSVYNNSTLCSGLGHLLKKATPPSEIMVQRRPVGNFSQAWRAQGKTAQNESEVELGLPTADASRGACDGQLPASSSTDIYIPESTKSTTLHSTPVDDPEHLGQSHWKIDPREEMRNLDIAMSKVSRIFEILDTLIRQLGYVSPEQQQAAEESETIALALVTSSCEHIQATTKVVRALLVQLQGDNPNIETLANQIIPLFEVSCEFH